MANLIDTGIGSIVETVKDGIVSVVGTSDAKLTNQLENRKLDLQSDTQQVEINKIEAASDKGFKSNWRPAVGWICAFGLAYEFMLMPILPWLLIVVGVNGVPPLPKIDIESLLTIVFLLLGLGTMRTIDKRIK